MAKIIVSYDDTAADRDALALGRLLSGGGSSLSLAYVRHSVEADPSLEELARHEAEKLLEGGATELGYPDIPRHIVVSPSTPEGLRDLAAAEGAEVVVFGSEYRTAPGHVDPQTSARRLLEGGTLAVALAPAGLHENPNAKLGTVASVSENGDPSARETAESLARSLGAAIAERPSPAVDLVVIGSRPGGADRRVTLSAAAWYLLETVRSAVLAVPRGTAVRFDAPASVHGGLAVTSIPDPG